MSAEMPATATPSVTLSNSEDSQAKAAKGGRTRKSKGRTRTTNSEEGEGSVQGKRKRTQNACTTCRQQKLRCDGSTKFPAPCSRCADHGLPCRVDPTFKRTPARQRLEEVSRQLEHMREKLELRSVQPDGEAPDSETGEDHTPTIPFPVTEFSLLPQRIGDIEILPDAIVALFHEFYSHYHPHMPIVNTTAPLESIFVESPLLFNTILFIACRHHPIHSSLYKRLVPPLKVLLSEFSIGPNRLTVDKNIQALLLLCSWPLPFGKQSEDGSWLRCGMASHLALQNWFHRPGFANEFREKLSKDELRRRTVTWLACFLADFSLSSKLGLPATVVPDFTIRNPPPGLPEKFKQHLQIANTCSKFISALSNNQFSSTGLIDAGSRWSLIQLFDGELEALHTQFSQATPLCPLSAESEILLLTNRLHLHIYVLHEDIQNTVGVSETSGMMIKGFRAAVKLIDAISNEHQKDMLKFYPTYIIRSLVTAALWLLKLMAVSDSRKSTQALDNLTEPRYTAAAVALLDNKSIEIGENHVREAFTILSKFSITEDDESQRASRFIEIIGGSRGDGNPSSVGWGHSVRMRGGMASGLVYDAVWEKRERERLYPTKGPSHAKKDTNMALDRSRREDIHDTDVPPSIGLEHTCYRSEPDAMPVDQEFWGMLGDLDGFSSWDYSWDNVFGTIAPVDS